MAAARSTTPSELATYRAKRDFTKTREPVGKAREGAGYEYLIQKHAASGFITIFAWSWAAFSRVGR